MTTSVAIIEGPLPPLHDGSREPTARDVGAVLIFEGVVRADEGGRQLAALCYEAYMPMALRQLELLAAETASRHGLVGIAVWHSVGRVPVGGVSLRVVVRSAHRAEALAAMGEFVTLLKRDVPIWKHPEWAQMP